MRRGRYYLSRVVKSGALNQEGLRAAIVNPPTIAISDALWTITDIVDGSSDAKPFLFGRLSKYAPEGPLTVVDPVAHSQLGATAKNLLIAAAPFVYLPDFSGIAYLHVWNGVQEDVFRRRFSRIVEEAHQRFFVRCEVDPVSDYKAFSTKLMELSEISELRAKVKPPNPLFGDLWRDLNKYIKERNASEVIVAEKSDRYDGLRSELVELVTSILEDLQHDLLKPAAIADAAILMAADGYGSGKIIGKKGSEPVSIRTSDTKMSFLYEKEPIVEEFASMVRKKFEQISSERNMEHG